MASVLKGWNLKHVITKLSRCRIVITYQEKYSLWFWHYTVSNYIILHNVRIHFFFRSPPEIAFISSLLCLSPWVDVLYRLSKQRYNKESFLFKLILAIHNLLFHFYSSSFFPLAYFCFFLSSFPTVISFSHIVSTFCYGFNAFLQNHLRILCL